MIVAAFLVQILLLIKATWLFREQINPDAISYLRIAGYWMHGETDLMVSGVWGPLFSWLMIPWLLVFEDGLLAAHAAMACSAVVFLFGAYRLLCAMRLPRQAVVVGTWLTAFLSAAWSTVVISPDLLMAGIFCIGVSRLLDLKGRTKDVAQWCPGWVMMPRYVWPDRAAFLTGMIFGAAYLAKHAALPISVMVIAALACFGFSNGVKKTAMLALGVMLVAGPWIGLLSYKYGKPVISTIGPIQHAIVGPPDMERDHPDHRHFYKPEQGRITVAEDPTNLPYNYWSPLESWDYARHQAALIYHNALLAVKFLQSFDWLGLGLFSAICGMLGLCTRSSTH